VAYDAQGTILRWNGVALGELVSIDLGFGSAASSDYSPLAGTSRLKKFVPGDIDPGAVSVVLRSSVAMSSSNVGLTATLSINGPDITASWSVAMFNDPKWRASVNALQEWSVNFKVRN
jgi:hypothetical protein